MSAPSRHVFQSQPSAGRRWENAVLWLFRSATYLVLLCGALVFGNIVFKGSQTVFQTSAPFINIPFLTQAPESLYVFEYQGKKRYLLYF
jgi:phosphate transport system permease protein